MCCRTKLIRILKNDKKLMWINKSFKMYRKMMKTNQNPQKSIKINQNWKHSFFYIKKKQKNTKFLWKSINIYYNQWIFIKIINVYSNQ